VTFTVEGDESPYGGGTAVDGDSFGDGGGGSIVG
jgi:hypothetical protein